MTTPTKRIALLSASSLLLTSAVFAQADGTWATLTSPASWQTASNWVGNIIATGANQTADFSTLNPTANRTVTLDGAVTIGNFIFGDTTPSATSNWVITNGSGGSLTLAGTNPTITVNNMSSSFGSIQATLGGTSGFTKNGVGNLILNNAANTITGAIIMNGGNIQLNSASLTNATSVAINAGNLLIANSAANAVGGTITFGGGGIQYNNAPGTDYSTQFSTAAGQVYRINSIPGAGVVTLGADLTSSGGSFIKSNTGTVNLTGVNTFNGGLTVSQGTLTTGATGTFGSGNVTVTSGAFLTAGNASSFFDGGQLTFTDTAAAGSINLNFVGVDTIGAVFDTVSSTFLAAGTYNATQLNAYFAGNSDVFTGTGSLQVGAIPEPSSFAALAGLGALGFVASRRRRQASK